MRRTAPRRIRALITTTALLAALSPAAAQAAPHVITAGTPAAGEVRSFTAAVDGTLSALAGASAAQANPFALAVHPDGRSAYAVDINSDLVFQYDVAANGTLTPKSPASVLSAPTASLIDMAVAPDGRHAYLADVNGNVLVTAIAPDGDLGATTVVAVPGGLGAVSAVAVHPRGHRLYVRVDTQLRLYDIAADGSISPNGAAPVTTGGNYGDMVFTPDGGDLFAGAGTLIWQYGVAADGTLTPRSPASVPGAQELAITPDGRFVYATPPGGGIRQYAVQPDGTLSALTPATTGSNTNLGSILASPTGDSVYLVERGGPIWQFSIGASGALVPKTPASLTVPSANLRAGAITPQADLGLTIASAPATADADVDYTITATNVQGSFASGIRVTSPLPADLTFVSATTVSGSCTGTAVVTCDLEPLGQGRSATITVRAKPTRTGTIPLAASVTALQPDPVAGNNSATGGATVTPRPGATTAPATAIAETGATLAGVVAPSGTNTTYRFEYGPTAAYGSTTPVTAAGSAPGLVTAAISGLTAGTTYHFRVVATNDEGATVEGEDRTFTTTPAPPPPAPPRVTTAPATGIEQTAATLAGVVAPSGTNTTYRFEYGPTAAYGSTTPATAATTPGLVTAAISGLTAGTTYHFRVVATNDEGAAVEGEDRTFTTATPPKEPEVKIETKTVEVPVERRVTVQVPGPPVPVPAPAGDTTVPVLSRVALARDVLRLELSEAATVRGTIAVRRQRRVRRRGRTRTVTTWTTVRRVTLTAGGAGEASVRLRALAQGRYRVTLQAVDRAGNTSRTVTTQATVKAAAR